jgi:YesN/AraC family two-component response regulator
MRAAYGKRAAGGIWAAGGRRGSGKRGGGIVLGYSLVVCEDETTTRDTVVRMVQGAFPGIDVVGSFSNGEEAISCLRSKNVDIIITDIRMPNVSGIELCEYACRNSPKTRTVVLSGYGEFEYAQKCIEYDVDAYLLKPIDFHELFGALEKICKKIAEEKPDQKADRQPERGEGGGKEKEGKPFFGELAKDMAKSDKSVDIIIEKAKEFVKKNCQHDISRDSVAEAMYVSPTYFSHIFKQKTRMMFKDYVIQVKMEKAIELLKKKKTIAEICERIGYGSKKNFYYNFKRHTSYTPTEYVRHVLLSEDAPYDADES